MVTLAITLRDGPFDDNNNGPWERDFSPAERAAQAAYWETMLHHLGTNRRDGVCVFDREPVQRRNLTCGSDRCLQEARELPLAHRRRIRSIGRDVTYQPLAAGW